MTALSDRVTPRSGLLSYWKFDEASGSTAADSKGSRPVTLANVTAGAPGLQVGEDEASALSAAAASFPSGYAGVGGIVMGEASGWSIAALIDVPGANTNGTIYEENSVGTGTNSLISLRLAGNKVQIQRRNDSSSSATSLLSAATMAVGVHHIVVTYDPAGPSMNCYIDGVFDKVLSATALTMSASKASAHCSLWVTNGGAAPPFASPSSYLGNTRLDEVQLYSRPLTAAEIAGDAAAAFGLPANTSAPAVTGTPRPGQTLTVNPGTWTGSPTFTYQWQADAVNITGATSSTYSVQADDVGKSIRCVVTATNGGGSTSANSNTLTILPLAPTNTGTPVVSGTPVVGNTLLATSGTWTGSPTFAYQWQRDGADISGATSTTYVLVEADVDTSVRCVVTATNGGGSTSAASNALTVSAPATLPPVPGTAPVVTGVAITGGILSCSQGSWSNNPTSFGYQWRRNGDPIAGAVSSTYTLIALDEGQSIDCRVTAQNNAGNATATSNAVIGQPNVGAPTQDFLHVAAETGLVGTLYLEVVAVADGTIAHPRSAADIVELVEGTGVYRARRPQLAQGRYALLWDEGTQAPGQVVVDDLQV
jgi:hypothetical protein